MGGVRNRKTNNLDVEEQIDAVSKIPAKTFWRQTCAEERARAYTTYACVSAPLEKIQSRLQTRVAPNFGEKRPARVPREQNAACQITQVFAPWNTVSFPVAPATRRNKTSGVATAVHLNRSRRVVVPIVTDFRRFCLCAYSSDFIFVRIVRTRKAVGPSTPCVSDWSAGRSVCTPTVGVVKLRSLFFYS